MAAVAVASIKLSGSKLIRCSIEVPEKVVRCFVGSAVRSLLVRLMPVYGAANC